MTRRLSLRSRLTTIIMAPTLGIAVLAGLWQIANARRTADEVFDRSLLSAALAVERDVAISQGDALSVATRDLLADTSGGQVYYHVYAPDGVFVAGYATPPVGIPRSEAALTGAQYFEATYLGQPVRGVRLRSRSEIDDLPGIFTTTVWQNSAVRAAFVDTLVMRSAIVISGLIAALALSIWFGVRLGLSPLLDLEEAIRRRSRDDLAPIRRAVPLEVRGIVATLNRLFEQVTRSMAAQREFIADAAHQLRNPIAGVLSMAEAVQGAPDDKARLQRSEDLLAAARELSELGQKVLLLERARHANPAAERAAFDLAQALQVWVEGFRRSLRPGVTLDLETGAAAVPVRADATMLREAIGNLIENAVRHGGEDLAHIAVRLEPGAGAVRIVVEDDGCGLAEADLPKAMERFTGLSETSGSGLGLSIARAIAEAHGGTARLESRARGLRAIITIPRQPAR